MSSRARLAIARSILADQPVLVLDEPTAHLDHATATELADEVLHDEGGARSVVWITHDRVGLDLVDEVVELGTAQDDRPYGPGTRAPDRAAPRTGGWSRPIDTHEQHP